MPLSKRRKWTLAVLLLYWPLLFVLGHIPIPQVVYRARVSDKSLHLLAYLVLAFLLWFTINPDKKVSWRGVKPWLVLGITFCYGALDELLQRYVGRTCDIIDFSVNLFGVTAGLLLFTFLSFWPSMLVVAGTAVFILANVSQVNLIRLLPVTGTFIYIVSYGVFTIIWVQYLRRFSLFQSPNLKWLAAVSSLPVALLIFAELFSALIGNGFKPSRAAASAGGVVAAAIIFSLASLMGRCFVHRRVAGSSERPI